VGRTHHAKRAKSLFLLQLSQGGADQDSVVSAVYAQAVSHAPVSLLEVAEVRAASSLPASVGDHTRHSNFRSANYIHPVVALLLTDGQQIRATYVAMTFSRFSPRPASPPTTVHETAADPRCVVDMVASSASVALSSWVRRASGVP